MKKYLTNLIETECENLMKCQSDFIVKCYGIFTNGRVRVIVMEYCRDGNLADLLYKRTKGFSEEEVVLVLKQLLLGIVVKINF